MRRDRLSEIAVTEIEKRLADLGLVLPVPAAPVANYVPFVRSGSLLFISGQLPFGADGKIAREHSGKVGGAVTPADGQAAARLCAINILAQVKAALGSLEQARCVRMTGFVAAEPGFIAIPQVINGASDLMVAVHGEKGRHARSAVGVAQLPLDCAVEIEATFEIG